MSDGEMNGVNNKLEEILEILKHQNATLERQDTTLEELKERMERLEKNQKALEANQDGLRGAYHEFGTAIGAINQRCDARCQQLQESVRIAAEATARK